MNYQKYDAALYFKVFGLAEDEQGNPCYGGVKISVGQSDHKIPYSEIKRQFTEIDNWQQQLLDMLLISDTIKPDAVEMITPEEYERDYGGDECDEDEED